MNKFEIYFTIPIVNQYDEIFERQHFNEIVTEIIERTDNKVASGENDNFEMSEYRIKFNGMFSIELPEDYIGLGEIEIPHVNIKNPIIASVFGDNTGDERFMSATESAALYLIPNIQMVETDFSSLMRNKGDYRFLLIKREEFDITNEDLFNDQPTIVRGSDEHKSIMRERLEDMFEDDLSHKIIRTDEGIIIHYTMEEGTTHGKLVMEYNDYQFVGYFDFGSEDLSEKEAFIEKLLGSIRLSKTDEMYDERFGLVYSSKLN